MSDTCSMAGLVGPTNQNFIGIVNQDPGLNYVGLVNC